MEPPGSSQALDGATGQAQEASVSASSTAKARVQESDADVVVTGDKDDAETGPTAAPGMCMRETLMAGKKESARGKCRISRRSRLRVRLLY